MLREHELLVDIHNHLLCVLQLQTQLSVELLQLPSLALHNQQLLLPLLVRFDLNLKVILHECAPFIACLKLLLQLGSFELQLLYLKLLIQITSALCLLQLVDLLSQLSDHCALLRVLFLPNLVRFFMINFVS